MPAFLDEIVFKVQFNSDILSSVWEHNKVERSRVIDPIGIYYQVFSRDFSLLPYDMGIVAIWKVLLKS